jgi:hypothetical protein
LGAFLLGADVTVDETSRFDQRGYAARRTSEAQPTVVPERSAGTRRSRAIRPSPPVTQSPERDRCERERAQTDQSCCVPRADSVARAPSSVCGSPSSLATTRASGAWLLRFLGTSQ